MPARHADPTEQFQAVEALLTRWLKERRQVLGCFTELVVAQDYTGDRELLQKCQRELCQLLVDYVSAGHFEVFHELISEAESFADGSGSLAESIIPTIGDTTEVILAYEEKYTGDKDNWKGLKRDLTSLGEVLELRFVWEDRLIAGLHSRHRQLLPEPSAGDSPQGISG